LLLLKNYFKKTKKPARGPSPGMFLTIAICLLLILAAAGCNLNPTPPIPEITGSIEGYVFERISPITLSIIQSSGAQVSVSNSAGEAKNP